MSIFELKENSFEKIRETSLSELNVKEKEIKQILRDDINVITPDSEDSSDLKVISEEFSYWEDSKRKIDLLCVDRDAKLVVVELKRGDGGHMELQAIRYSAMVSSMNFDFNQAVKTYESFLSKYDPAEKDKARITLLNFMNQTEKTINDVFGNDVRIILVSEEFSKEIQTTALWLHSRGIAIHCVKLIPHKFESGLLVNIEEIIPGKEIESYEFKHREEAKKTKAETIKRDNTRFNLTLDSKEFDKLTKRKVIFHTIQHLVDKGISPEELVGKFDFLDKRFLCIESDVSFEEFKEEYEKKVSKEIQWWRFFTKEEELLKINNKTYVLSTQWGGREWLEETIKSINESFDQFDIQLEAVDPTV